jgi:hypothetical protein
VEQSLCCVWNRFGWALNPHRERWSAGTNVVRCSGGSRRRIISDDYHLETGDGRRCLRQRVRHHELPLPLPSSSRRPLALECARALEPSADSRVLRFVCLHSFITPACRQMPQPSPPLPLLLSTCAVASIATGTLTLERARPPSQLTYAYAC